MRLIEREFALGQLRAAFAESVQGSGRVVVIQGVVGSGKTELVRTFAEQVDSTGATFLHAGGTLAERNLTLGVVRQLFAGNALDADAVRIFRKQLDQGLATKAYADESFRASVLHNFCTVLLDQAERAPVVIIVDDIHYLDTFSQKCLFYLIRRATSARILVLLTAWDGIFPGHRMFYTDLYPQVTYCRRLQLTLLSRDGVTEMISERLGGPVASHLADNCYAVSSGNPFLVRALISDYQACAQGETLHSPLDVVVGNAFVQSVLSIMHRGELATFRVACALAVLGQGGQPTLLGHLSGVAPNRVATAVDVLSRSGLLESGWFRHPYARDAVLAAMTAENSAKMHWRAAQLLRSAGADAISVARHLVAAGRTDCSWALPNLVDAAEQALTEGRTRMAVDFLQSACRTRGDEQRRLTIMATLARAEFMIDPTNAVRYLAELTDAVREGRLRGREAAMTIVFLLWHGRATEALNAMNGLLASATDVDTETARGIAALRQWLPITYPAFLQSARCEREPVGPSASLASGRDMSDMLVSVLVQSPDEGTISRADHILRQYRVAEDTLAPLISSLLTLICAERLAEADRACTRLLRQASVGQTPSWYALFAAIAAEIALRKGSLVVTENYARSALSHLPFSGWGVAVGYPLGSLALAQTQMGNYEQASQNLGLRVPETMFDTPAGLHYLLARGRYNLAIDLPQVALEDFAVCGEVMDRWGLDLPGLVPWRAEMAAVYLRIGEYDEARRYAEEQLRRLGSGPSRARGRTIRLLATTRDLRHRPPMLWEAVTILQGCGDRFELANALGDLHHTYRMLGQTNQARSAARRANAASKACHEVPLSATLPAAISEQRSDEPNALSGQESSASSSLSEAERKVAVLAVQSYTNREIAGELYVTTSTVEQHLTRIYRKLGVNRRADLLARLGQDLPNIPRSNSVASRQGGGNQSDDATRVM
jgi:DNA-binding CsgD family transcriptional regulator/nucleoside-triphosphatase THEP1